ncbi:SWIM zinc finger family protein [Streptomyces sp. NPDC051132]|uniref:SWIM zinc finger family protein n=1 Tax=unclassified Streptomyces TaxID=2593676 RepID=UPI0034401189
MSPGSAGTGAAQSDDAGPRLGDLAREALRAAVARRAGDSCLPAADRPAPTATAAPGTTGSPAESAGAARDGGPEGAGPAGSAGSAGAVDDGRGPGVGPVDVGCVGRDEPGADTPRGAGPNGTGSGPEVGPVDAGCAGRDEPGADTSPGAGPDGAGTGRRSEHGGVRAGARIGDTGDAPSGGIDGGPSGGAAGRRPGDVAREALRAARREAARAEAAEAGEAGRAGEGTVAAGPGRERRAAAAARSAASRTPVPPGRETRSAKAGTVRDMRHYLSTAFRMPAWTETPGEPETSDGSAAGPTGPAAPSATTEPAAPVEPDQPPLPAPAPTASVTMASPHRDGELRRTFPAFTSRVRTGADEAFAGTWWGNAWVGALEQGALDAKRLARGRSYADQGHVDAITVTPGLVLAYVRGSRPRPYRTQVRLRTLEDEGWDRFLDAAAGRPGHIAALLDKELPQSLADCGVPLLPGPGDLVPRCSCPDSGHPCKHAAALCYQTARLLDADPFVLLLLRGRGEKDLLDALSRRSAAHAARAARERQPRTLPGVRAAEALAARERPPLPPPSPVPPHPGQPPVYPSAPGGPDSFALDQLATDAAARAHALLGTGHDPVGGLTLWQDAVRLAAARPGSGLTAATRALYAALADGTGRTPADLARAVAAWRQGGLEGLTVLEEPWDPPAGRFDRARPLLLAADLPAFRPWRNRLTHPRGHVQLRLGRDGLWYAYESEPGQDDWWPRGTPDHDPVGALTGLGAAGDL